MLQTVDKDTNKTRDKSVRIRREQLSEPPSAKPFPFWGVALLLSLLFSLSFAPKQVKLIHNHSCFLTRQTDIPEVQSWVFYLQIVIAY